MPGITPDKDYIDLLDEVPDENKEKVIGAIDFVFNLCSSSSDTCDEIPKEWETAYDMRPWTAFPERK